jgi:hypothetical protein
VAGLFELADIGARDEGLFAGPDQDHDPDVRVVAQPDQRVAEPFPHLQRHGVALVGIVEGDDADAIAGALLDLAVGIGNFGNFGDVEHRLRLSLMRLDPLSDKPRAEVNRRILHEDQEPDAGQEL